jgi:hypothetical protein
MKRVQEGRLTNPNIRRYRSPLKKNVGRVLKNTIYYSPALLVLANPNLEEYIQRVHSHINPLLETIYEYTPQRNEIYTIAENQFFPRNRQ